MSGSGSRQRNLLSKHRRVERSFAHFYETGAMRRTHLRRHENIIKRLLIHACAFNLGLVLGEHPKPASRDHLKTGQT
jgi:hypothetical protein